MFYRLLLGILHKYQVVFSPKAGAIEPSLSYLERNHHRPKNLYKPLKKFLFRNFDKKKPLFSLHFDKI